MALMGPLNGLTEAVPPLGRTLGRRAAWDGLQVGCVVRVIGIGGPSGSGKTRVARELAITLPRASVLGADAYYLDRSGLASDDLAAVNFDAPSALDWDLLVLHLHRLKDGRRVGVPRYDFATHSRLAAPEWVEPCETLVLEGLFALWEPRVRSLLDLAVFMEAPQELCLARRIARDTGTRGRTESSVREQWRRDVAPMFVRHVLPTRARADLVLDGAASPARSALAIRARTRSLMGSGATAAR